MWVRRGWVAPRGGRAVDTAGVAAAGAPGLVRVPTKLREDHPQGYVTPARWAGAQALLRT